MKFSSAIVLMAAQLASIHVEAFTPTPLRTQSLGTTSATQLYARYSPPPPPPPPAPLDDPSGPFAKLTQKLVDKVDDSFKPPNVELDPSAVMDEITKQLDGFQLPSLPWNELKEQVQRMDAQMIGQLGKMAQDLQSGLVERYPSAKPLFDKVASTIQKEPSLAFLQTALNYSPPLTILVSAVLTYSILTSVMSWGETPPPSQPYPTKRYDPIAARAYFDRRLPMVMRRGLEILVKSLKFGINVLQDKVDDKISDREFQRGKELAELLTALGPTFIKVGQSLSIRTDLLSPAYVRGLTTLQDQVPSFDTAIARQILEAEWGTGVESMIDQLTPMPIASASLGQVYKAKLKSTGQEVAVKVQRPNIMEQIALDMYLLREVAPVVKRLFNLNSDTVGTVDAWGAGFVDELDYMEEAKNAQFFMEQIQNTPLKEVVFAPSVVESLSTDKVLVTEWCDGQRLDKSAASDVSVLCSIAMNTYLTMLLDIGLLHCDPHPGNLLRTKDGRLCILDWGMVTRLDGTLQLTLIEHVAHLTSDDFAEIPRDLLLLGFIPENKADEIEDSGVVEVLADIYGAWKKGGGAAAINVNEVVNQLQDLTAEKGNLFQIPPYFAYIAKSFSVLEGIGLTNEPNYSIINECLPYVSKRLLSDAEECGPALSTFIFGPDKTKPDRMIDYGRVKQLVEGFGSFTTSASGALIGKEDVSRVELLEESSEEILNLVFAEEETPLQEIFVDQMAKIMSSGGRSVFTQLREMSGVLPSGRTLLGTLVDPLGVWRTSPLVRMNELDEHTVDTTIKLVELMRDQLQNTNNPLFDLSDLSREEAAALSSILVRKMWDRRRGVMSTGNRLVRKLLELTAEKLERGERDTRRLPPPPPPAPESAVTQPLLAREEDRADDSPRLQEARRLLEGFQDVESAGAPMPEPVPVSTRF